MIDREISALKGNVFGGFTAAVVALPLALAFGVASGAGPMSGVYGAIGIGLFATLFGGTATQISGPTGPMTVVMASVLTLFLSKYPNEGFGLAFTVVMLGGISQILLGYFKLGRFIYLVPYTVVSGFMSGIGVIIILLQLNAFMGSTISAQQPLAVIQQLPELLSSVHTTALALGTLLLTTLFLWPASFNKWLPAPLFILFTGTLLSLTVFNADEFVRLGEIPSGLPSIQIPTLKYDVITDMLKYGIILGVLGSIDSLLTSLVADTMTRTEHQSDKELIGQGLGNIVAGLLGGLPGAGATMRTVVNIRAGATSRLSGVIHAITLVLLISVGGPYVSQIPLVVLSAILMKVGIDIIDWDFLRRRLRAPNSSIAIMMTVFVLTVFVDLITAVSVGIIFACITTVNRLTREQLNQVKTIFGENSSVHLDSDEMQVFEGINEHVLIFSLSGPFSFGAAKGLSRKLIDHNGYEILILDLIEVPSIDTSTALAIEDIIKNSRQAHRLVILACDNANVISLLEQLNVIKILGEHKVCETRLAAIIKARQLLFEQILRNQPS